MNSRVGIESGNSSIIFLLFNLKVKSVYPSIQNILINNIKFAFIYYTKR